MVLLGYGPPFLSAACHRFDVDVMHPAEIRKQRAPFVDDHGVDVEPVPVAGRRLDIVGRFRGK